MVKNIKLTINNDLKKNVNSKIIDNKYINLKKKYITSLKVIKILIEKNKRTKILYSDLLSKYEIQNKEIKLYHDKLNINKIEINALEFLIGMYQEKY